MAIKVTQAWDGVDLSLEKGSGENSSSSATVYYIVEGTQKAAEKTDATRSVGAWSAEELDALLGGGNAQERTAKASEQIAANTRETNRQIKRLRGGSSTNLTYA